ncbi:MAG TPA: sulfite exporter TauE/SafE family protein [Burkholderiales bacterium]|nr:sulfite exporter TauE/SafE family protein [Burkholderiales bacterium]
MTVESIIALAILIFLAALLYSSVGHAGASAYIAAMALFSVAPSVMRPAALTLNILVAVITTFKYHRAGFFSWRVFWPFALTSVPLAFIGGRTALPDPIYKVLIGLVLLYAGYRIFATAAHPDAEQPKSLPLSMGLVCGAIIGFISGLTGVGGGIFLSPVLIFSLWATVKQTSGIAAAFILVNSIAGLLGLLSMHPALPPGLPWWALAALSGGWMGAELGSRRFANPVIRKLLALVLLIAGSKMIFTA